jgi:hypothetical protein
MLTPSHLIITAAVRKRFRHLPLPTSALLIGSVAPDLALTLLSLGGTWYYQNIVGLTDRETFRHMYDTMFFRDPVWISLHNLLHSPTMLLIGLAATWRWRWRLATIRRWIFWFLLACLGHTALDIPTHHDDGPLLFWPFEWTIRFPSPISYWDRRYYGEQFAVFELILGAVLLLYLVGPIMVRGVRRLTGRAQPSE